MISMKINDINNFMHQLLINDIFDSFLLCDGEIHTAHSISINGRINKSFFNEDELKTINDEFVAWKDIKHICFETIKGKKVPSKLKLVFALSKNAYPKLIQDSGIHLQPENIGGCHLHVLYENNTIEIITGTTLNVFTLDKTLDTYWDNLMKEFLSKHFDISVE